MSPATHLVPQNLERFPDLHPALDSQSALAESNRCLFCFDAPCTAACPTHIDVPRFIKKIATGNLRGSALTILDANILGLSCSRVCPVDVLCEGACVMHRYNKKPIEIGLLQRHAMEHFYAQTPLPGPHLPVPGPQPPVPAPQPPIPGPQPPTPEPQPPVLGPQSPANGPQPPAPAFRAPEPQPPISGPRLSGPRLSGLRPPAPNLWPPPFRPPAPTPSPRLSGPQPPPPAPAFQASTACIGAGPASLACAAELRRHGRAVTIFDSRPLPGGLNTYGVAEYKLRPSVSLQEVALIRNMGVEFRQQEITSLPEIENDFDFIFLGVGLGAMERLGIPGEDGPNVIDALRFIARYKTSPGFQSPNRVVVIGGGNTAIDAANAAIRLGAQEVHLFYRRTEKEMPAFSFEYDHSKMEGVRFHWFAQPVEILPHSVKFVKTQLTENRKPQPAPGSEFEFACDLVIPALGQSRSTNLLRGLTIADRATGQTSNPKIYAGGDCINGGREVVDAVADGKRAALGIIQRRNGNG